MLYTRLADVLKYKEKDNFVFAKGLVKYGECSRIETDKIEFIEKQLHICVNIDILNRKEMFIMNKKYTFVIIETLKLEGYYLL